MESAGKRRAPGRARVVMITQIFPPEMGALANRMYPMARALHRAGQQVSVATGMPSYPAGRVFPEYRGRRFLREERDGIVVVRTTYRTVARNVGSASQLLSYLSFLPAALHSALRAGPTDIVFVTSPPLFPVLPAMIVAAVRRAALIVDLRDLWPDEIVAVGAASEGSVPVRVIRALERLAYRRADIVTCTTQAFADTVRRRGVPQERIVLLPNGADLDLFRPLDPDSEVVAAYDLGDRFVVMYSGLFGLKHGLDSVVDAAAALRDRDDIVFFLRGEGPTKRTLQERVAAEGLSNVVFGDEIPIEDVPRLLARADACVTTLLPDPYLEKIISVKIFEYMACGKPVVGALGGEGARVIEAARAGLVVPPGDGTAIARAVATLADDPKVAVQMGARGAEHVAARYSRELTAERFAELVRQLFDPRSPRRRFTKSERISSLVHRFRG